MADVPEPLWKVPGPFRSLIGREQELRTLSALLLQPEVRLLTLHGMGGVGKTRLALALANDIRGHFADGICFIRLAPIREPERVLPEIIRELGIQERKELSPLEQLKVTMRERQILLILDNLEQVITVAPRLKDLLEACPVLKLLITSRERLRITAEYIFTVRPLELPELAHQLDGEDFTQYAAVELFGERAAQRGFPLKTEHMRTVAEICVLLDGLPLAIELAAARLNLLTPQAMLTRLSQHLHLQILDRGMLDEPVRLQTMRSTLEWSYHLLSPSEQRLFRFLSVFVGGCTLETIDEICKAEHDFAVESVDSLLDKSLLQRDVQTDGEPRLRLLEIPREYGQECLMANGEVERAQHIHAFYYLKLAEEAWPELSASHHEKVWLDRLEQDKENLRAAMQWFLKQGENGQSMEPALRLGAALERFWLPGGFGMEELRFMEQALKGRKGAAVAVQAKALLSAGNLALHLADLRLAETLAHENLSLCQEHEDQSGQAYSLYLLGNIELEENRPLKALTFFQEELALRRAIGDEEGVAWALLDLASAVWAQENYTEATTFLEESLAIFHKRDHPRGKARVLNAQGQIAFVQRHFMKAQQLLEQALTLFQELGIKRGIWNCHDYLAGIMLAQRALSEAYSHAEENRALARQLTGLDTTEPLILLARVAAAQRDEEAAQKLYEKLLASGRERDDKQRVYGALDGLARLAMAQDNPSQAIRLWGEAKVYQKMIHTSGTSNKQIASPEVKGRLGTWNRTPIELVEGSSCEDFLAQARDQLGVEMFDKCWVEGQTIALEHLLSDSESVTVSQQHAVPPSPPSTVDPPPAKSGRLTPRELKVLCLLAKGFTDKQIAQELTISERTVNTHLTRIYSKISSELGLISPVGNLRVLAADYARARHLCQ